MSQTHGILSEISVELFSPGIEHLHHGEPSYTVGRWTSLQGLRFAWDMPAVSLLALFNSRCPQHTHTYVTCIMLNMNYEEYDLIICIMHMMLDTHTHTDTYTLLNLYCIHWQTQCIAMQCMCLGAKCMYMVVSGGICRVTCLSKWGQ